MAYLVVCPLVKSPAVLVLHVDQDGLLESPRRNFRAGARIIIIRTAKICVMGDKFVVNREQTRVGHGRSNK